MKQKKFSSFPNKKEIFLKSQLIVPFYITLPQHKIIDMSKLKAFADKELDAAHNNNYGILLPQDRKHCGRRKKC